MLKKLIIIGIIGGAAIIGIVFGLIAYSYSQIEVSFNDISSVSVELETLTFGTLIKLGLDALSGNWMEAALEIISGINLGLVFGLSNNGLLPIYIPEITYDLSINEIPIGQGQSEINATINPGETTEILIVQNFEKNSIRPAIDSIISSQGIIDVNVSGTAYFEIWGQSIPVQFEESRQVSLVDEIQNQLNQQMQN